MTSVWSTSIFLTLWNNRMTWELSLRGFCVNESCTVLHCYAIYATSVPITYWKILILYGLVGTENPRVGSSILSLATINTYYKSICYFISVGMAGRGIQSPCSVESPRSGISLLLHVPKIIKVHQSVADSILMLSGSFNILTWPDRDIGDQIIPPTCKMQKEANTDQPRLVTP